MTWLHRLDRLIGRVIAETQWLALPLIFLLFLQWPLRDIFRAHSRDANDLGQIIFALFVAVSVTAATRAGTHLAADTIAQRYSTRARRLIRKFGVLAILPWAIFVLYAGKDFVVPSVLGLEALPDTNNPGYYIIKLALWIMAILIIAQAVAELCRPSDDT
jgi:TRAP-type mannitol/chloroaromatic compound transport system permease small subunit